MGIALIFMGITALFFLLLGVKPLFRGRLGEKFCAICLAVSLTWLSLLAFLWLKRFDDRILLALLMGQSVHGIYMLAEKHVKESLTLFRLPFLLSLTIIAYVLLVMPADALLAIGFTALLWLAFGLLYAYRAVPALRGMVKKIVECCMRW